MSTLRNELESTSSILNHCLSKLEYVDRSFIVSELLRVMDKDSVVKVESFNKDTVYLTSFNRKVKINVSEATINIVK